MVIKNYTIPARNCQAAKVAGYTDAVLHCQRVGCQREGEGKAEAEREEEAAVVVVPAKPEQESASNDASVAMDTTN